MERLVLVLTFPRSGGAAWAARRRVAHVALRFAASLELSAISPRSPRADEPNFDLAWEAGDSISVAEIKSTTPENEERQLRLGLGQVLRYRQLLEGKHRRAVRAVLVAERRPRDESWRDLCGQLAVLFTTPDEFGGRPWTETHPV
jgi:hypothetical protein